MVLLFAPSVGAKADHVNHDLNPKEGLTSISSVILSGLGGLGKPCAGEGGSDQVHWGVSIRFCPVDRTLDPETPGLRSLTQVQPRRYKHPLPGVCLGTCGESLPPTLSPSVLVTPPLHFHSTGP